MDCKEEPNLCCGYIIDNEKTGKISFFVKVGNHKLLHPNLSKSEMALTQWKFVKVDESLYSKYKKFLNKRNETTYLVAQRELWKRVS